MPEQTVAAYLVALKERLPALEPWRQDTLAEAGDHLLCAIEEGASEKEAVARFGSVEAIARQLTEEAAQSLNWSSLWYELSLAVGLLPLLLIASLGPFWTGHAGSAPIAFAAFLLSQFAYTCGALVLWRRAGIVRRGAITRSDLETISRRGLGAVAALVLVFGLRATLALASHELSPALLPLAGWLALALVWTRWQQHRLRLLAPALAQEPESGLARDLQLLFGPASRYLGPGRLLAAVTTLGASFAFLLGSQSDGLWPALAAQGLKDALFAGLFSMGLELAAVVACYLCFSRLLRLDAAR